MMEQSCILLHCFSSSNSLPAYSLNQIHLYLITIPTKWQRTLRVVVKVRTGNTKENVFFASIFLSLENLSLQHTSNFSHRNKNKFCSPTPNCSISYLETRGPFFPYIHIHNQFLNQFLSFSTITTSYDLLQGQ